MVPWLSFFSCQGSLSMSWNQEKLRSFQIWHLPENRRWCSSHGSSQWMLDWDSPWTPWLSSSNAARHTTQPRNPIWRWGMFHMKYIYKHTNDSAIVVLMILEVHHPCSVLHKSHGETWNNSGLQGWAPHRLTSTEAQTSKFPTTTWWNCLLVSKISRKISKSPHPS